MRHDAMRVGLSLEAHQDEEALGATGALAARGLELLPQALALAIQHVTRRRIETQPCCVLRGRERLSYEVDHPGAPGARGSFY